MKVVSWNVNGARSILGQTPSVKYGKKTKINRLRDYISQNEPDIICLQETKATPEQIDEDKRVPEGYEGFFNSSEIKKGYSGVVTYCKLKPIEVVYKLGIEKFDVEGRYVETEFEDFVLLNIYFPKGYAESERLAFKMDFYDAVFARLEEQKGKGKPIVVCGDYNTAHKEIDLARPKENVGTSGFMPEERQKLDELIEMGYADAFRLFESGGGHYSWWSQRGRARENNVGWRIDYHFVSDNIKGNIKKCYYQPEVEGSDHCPVVMEFVL